MNRARLSVNEQAILNEMRRDEEPFREVSVARGSSRRYWVIATLGWSIRSIGSGVGNLPLRLLHQGGQTGIAG